METQQEHTQCEPTELTESNCYSDSSDYNILVYKSPSIKTQLIDNFRSIVAVEDIPKGTLLILEQGLAADAMVCQIIVAYNEKLFNLYHPRTDQFQDLTHEQRQEQVYEKISHNCFGLGNGAKLLNIFIQGINHSCTANSSAYVRVNHSCENTLITFMEIITVRDVTKGSEITINYGPDTAHNRDFECKCGLDLEQRRKISDITNSTVKILASTSENTELFNYLSKEYLYSDVSKKLMLNQFLAVNGIYMNNNTIASYNSKGAELINRTLCRYAGIDPQAIESDDAPYSKEISAQKINIFLNILNDRILTRETTETTETPDAKID